LKPWETIGSFGVRNFMLCKKPHQEAVNGVDDKKPVTVGIRKGSGSWKAWFNKSLNLKVSSH
nr:UDP-3-O-acyl-N-acetylglucosamine deacetylase 5 precursor [Tanacetum cinerariifolium]